MSDVYIAGSLRHTPKEWWKFYENIGKVVKGFGFKVHVPHINTTGDVGINEDTIHNPDLDLETRSKVYQRNWDVVHNAKLIIAEVTNPSIGTGIEIGWGLKLNKPVICLARKSADVTSMVMGPVHLGQIDFIRYENEEDALAQLKNLLETKFKSLL
ncbi:MAG: nucleoside 2-deoxyribosyltransferase [Candidatus Aenigmarchaeota archaeon]|nr:nucleoside 2-deoxyribosyltransferase [Candidatus Aenigmarchaeota archaeon]